MTTKYIRFVELDVLRGWAVILMIFFHICYDLNYFGYIHIDIYEGVFWLYFRNLIVGIFLLCMGISLSLTHTPHIKWHKLKKRIGLLSLASLLVSLATYFVFPSAWVYFGILHFILSATVLGVLFIPYPGLSLLVSFLLYLAVSMGHIHMYWFWEFVNGYVFSLPVHTVDMVSFLPWFSFVLIGIAITSYGYHKKLLFNSFLNPSLKYNKTLSFLGKHALLIYLMHQPIIFGFLMLLTT